MDIFQVREQLIDDYRQFTSSFVKVREDEHRLKQHVDDRMTSGEQCPDAWVSLNPNFASGGTIDDLVREGPMTKAIYTGTRYQAILDPPPGHGPRHPDGSV